MGADGGFVYVQVTDAEAFRALTNWFSWRVLNSSCTSYEGTANDYREPDGPPDEGTWIEGGMGTDCDYDLETLVELAAWCASKEHPHVLDGNSDIRDYTFEELKSALLSDPDFDLWAWHERVYRPGAWWAWHTIGFIVADLQAFLQTQVPREDGFIHEVSTHPGYGQDVPPDFQNMTLREWGTRLNKLVVSHFSEETWT